jgi:hypothetical protein
MNKTLYTLNIGNYEPDITSLTFPLFRRYAEKIGADFHIITERKFPDMPVVYEKFQIFELGQRHKNEWNIFFDADTLISPDFWDVTLLLNKDTTCSGMASDFVPQRFRPDRYFCRDGRLIGKGNWCMIASDWCIDVWRPLDDMTLNEAVKNITPTQNEINNGVKPDHLIDDYVVSRNIAKYGLKHILISELERMRNIPSNSLFHTYVKPDSWENSVMSNGQRVFLPEEVNRILQEKGKPAKEFTLGEVKVLFMKKQLNAWGMKNEN